MFLKLKRKAISWFNEQVTFNNYQLDDLSPVDDIDNGEAYFKSLEWALQNDNIHNIAVTGPYGSGKSSVIRSFQKTHNNYKYLNISLASFREGASQDNKSKSKIEISPEENRLVEISIIQQIFYTVKASSIPDSRFKRIKSLSAFKLGVYVALAILGLVSLLYFLIPDFFFSFPFWRYFSDRFEYFIPYIAAALTLLSIAAILRYVFRFFRSKQFQKLNITSGEIEVNDDNEKSILNRHLDEILYFFEVTPFNVVIIEDLDRFKNHEIFTKLREINLLLNRSKQVKRKIVFIYALKDDMFMDKTRTKFFEFILPIVPVVNWHNSFSILRDKLNKIKPDPHINEEFIRTITLYIDDMRILKNIFNEFVIYRENLKRLKINQDQLLGLIVYKNIYPTDFALLHENKGIVYSSFAALRHLKSQKTSELASRISNLEKLILDADNEILDSSEELRSVYLQAIFQLQPGVRKVRVGSSYFDAQELRDKDLFNQLMEESRIDVSSDQGHSNTGKKFSDIEKKINAQKTFIDRLKDIENKKEIAKRKFRTDIAELISLKSQLERYSLKEFLDTFPETLPEFSKDLLERELLKYLLREGYIDEMYTSLLSYFYEGSLSKTDMDFLLGLKNRTPLEFTLPLSKIDEILKSITPTQWRSDCLLNYQFMDYVLDDTEKHSSEVAAIFNEFKYSSPTRVSFVFGYLDYGERPVTFINLLCRHWPGAWKILSEDQRSDPEFLQKLVRLIVTSCPGNVIATLDQESGLSDFISNKADFLLHFSEQDYRQNVKDALDNLNIKFKNLQISPEVKELAEYVYQNEYYELNPVMISFIVSNFGNENVRPEELETSNFTSIQRSGCEELIKYIDENIALYSNNVLEKLDENSKESVDTLVKLMNKDAIPLHQRISILVKSKNKLPEIAQVPRELWDEILSNLAMDTTWQNAIVYFLQTKKINNILGEYLSHSNIYNVLRNVKIDSQGGVVTKDELDDLFKDLVYSPEISNEAFDHLSRSIPIVFNGDLDFENISDNRIQVLIREDMLSMTPENFNALNSKPGMKLFHIEENIAHFKNKLSDFQLEPSDLELILISSRISHDDKLFIIGNTSDELITGQPQLANLICILIANSSMELNFEKLRKILTYADDRKPMLILFVNRIPHLTGDQIDELLLLMGDPYNLLSEKGRKPKLTLNREHTELGQRLKDVGYITSYKLLPDEDKIQYMIKTAQDLSNSSSE